MLFTFTNAAVSNKGKMGVKNREILCFCQMALINTVPWIVGASFTVAVSPHVSENSLFCSWRVLNTIWPVLAFHIPKILIASGHRVLPSKCEQTGSTDMLP